MQLHVTDDALCEEYAIATQVKAIHRTLLILQMYRFSTVDISEIARNSVALSGFEDSRKAAWLGANWNAPGSKGNGRNHTFHSHQL